MKTKSAIKVHPKVKKFSPFKFALNEFLIPGTRDIEKVVIWCMIECKVDRQTALNATFKALDYIDKYDLKLQDRDRLHLPNLKDRYPTYPDIYKFWKSAIQEPDAIPPN